MLTPQQVLEFIKLNLGFPYKALEHSDEAILNYIRNYTLVAFSEKVPQTWYKAIGDEDRIPNTMNEYFINDPDDRVVLTVRDVLVPREIAYLTGYPWNFMPTFEQVLPTELAVLESMTKNMVSLTN